MSDFNQALHNIEQEQEQAKAREIKLLKARKLLQEREQQREQARLLQEQKGKDVMERLREKIRKEEIELNQFIERLPAPPPAPPPLPPQVILTLEQQQKREQEEYQQRKNLIEKVGGRRAIEISSMIHIIW